MPQIIGRQFRAGKERGGGRLVGVKTHGGRGVHSEARRAEEGRYTHEVVGKDIVVAHATVDRIRLGRETQRPAIGRSDGQGTAIRKREGNSRERFRREKVAEFVEARSTEEDVSSAGVGDERGEGGSGSGERDGRRGWRRRVEWG